MAKKFPDLTGDGKVTRKDILKGRGVKLQSGGQAKSPTRPRNRKVDRGIIERGGVTPIRFITGLVLDRMEKRDERKYMDHLDKMGMFDEGGGRANVPPKGGRSKPKPKPKPKSDTEKLMDESREKYRPNPKTLPGAPPRDYNPRKKSPPRKMKPLKVADGGRVTTFRNGGAAITKTNQKPHMS